MSTILGLPSSDRERLAKLLALLGSDHPGERDAAGLAAHRLVTASGVTWCDVVCIPQDRHTKERVEETSAFTDWRSLAMACGRHQYFLNKWEAQFVSELPRFPRLSSKQSATLTTIVTRLRAAGCDL